ncbi:MAG: hypothetical protein K6C97_12630 [Treponema sp.]|nr:hypothetical protein [Treponema sp.]
MITNTGVIQSDKLDKINKHLDASIEADELKFFGSDQVINMTNSDIDFVQDKKKLSKIMFGNFFVKDKTPTLFGMIEIVMLFLILVLK